MLNVFAELVRRELCHARFEHYPMRTAHEGLAVLLEEFDEFKAEVWKKEGARSNDAMLKELVQIGAMAQRVAEDLGLTEPS